MSISNYIFNREPQRFGSQQDDYVLRSNQVVTAATEQLSKAISAQSDLQQYFHSLIDFLGKERNAIAVAHHTPDAEHFGLRRDSDQAIESNQIHSYTPLNGDAYCEYGQKMLLQFQKSLTSFRHDKRQFYEKLKIEEGPVFLERRSKFEIQLFEGNDIYKQQWHLPPDYSQSKNVKEILKHSEWSLKEKMVATKKAEPACYKQDRMHFILKGLRNTYPQWKMSDFVLGTSRLQIDGQMYAMSQYMTWMYRDYESDPVEHMSGRSCIVILHQDTFLIEATLKNIAAVFKKAVQWNSQTENLTQLQNTVGLLRYIFAHTMPFVHGSAAIGEFLEQTIYRHHGFNVEYAHNKSIDLEALTSFSLQDFINVYSVALILKDRPKTNSDH